MSSAPDPRYPADLLKRLPIDTTSEKCLISCLLRQPALFREKTMSLSPEDFCGQAHRKIVQAMVALDEEGIVPDPAIIADRLGEPGVLTYLDELYDVVASPKNARYYSEKLRQVMKRRQAIFDASRLLQAANSGIPEDIARVRAEISKISSGQPERAEWRKYRITISRATTDTPPPQKFIVGHLPEEPGNYGLIIGPDGVRKSWLTLHIALSVAGGRPVAKAPTGSCLWTAPAPGRVVYITSEDSPNVIWRRIWNIGQMPGYDWIQEIDEKIDILPTISNLALLSTAQDGSIVQTAEYNEIVQYAQGSRLIVLDPLSDLFDLDENGNREGRAIVQALRQLSLRTGAGVLGVHHQNKIGMMNGEKHAQSSRGSSKIPAGSRWTIILQPGEDPDWTCITEGKASYARRDSEKWLHVLRIDDGAGREIASVPVASDPPRGKPIVVDQVGGLKYPEEERENETYY